MEERREEISGAYRILRIHLFFIIVPGKIYFPLHNYVIRVRFLISLLKKNSKYSKY